MYCVIAMKNLLLLICAAIVLATVGALAETNERGFRQHPYLVFDSETNYTADIALADVDGDGDLDALTANGRHWAQQDFVFLNAGTGRLLEAVPLGSRLGATYMLCPGDFDLDGDIDIVVVRDNLPAQLFLNDGKATFTFASELPGSGGAARSATVADVNGDDRPDVIIARRRGTDLLFFGNNDGGFEVARNLPGDGRGSVGITTSDVDKDGDIDLIIARRNQQASVVMTNDGSGEFEARALNGSLGDHRKSVVADVTQDGWPDIILVSTDGQHKIYAGGSGARYDSFTVFGKKGRVSMAMAAADLDDDGDIDLVEGTETTNALYFNLGNNQFHRVEMEGEFDTYGVAIGDMNGDAKLDLVFANSEDANVVLLAK